MSSVLMAIMGRRRTAVPIVISPASPSYPQGFTNTAYDGNVDFAVTGGTPPYTFTNIGGFIPTGLSQATPSSTRLTGTPTDPTSTSYSIGWRVQDSGGSQATFTSGIFVQGPPIVAFTGSTTVPAGTPAGTQRGIVVGPNWNYNFITNGSTSTFQGAWLQNDAPSNYEMFMSVTMGTHSINGGAPLNQWFDFALWEGIGAMVVLSTPGRISVEIRRKGNPTVLNYTLFDIG